jgi:putative acetyltransferase
MNQHSPSSEIEIRAYSKEDKNQVLEVWEKSVIATHTFLAHFDFIEIKALVKTIDFESLEVYCLVKNADVIGFIGVAECTIEMLFVLPEYIGKGLGKQLCDFALSKLHANKVDVNEQNENAFQFYEKMGFEIYERTKQDDQGRNYPLLRMKLK